MNKSEKILDNHGNVEARRHDDFELSVGLGTYLTAIGIVLIAGAGVLCLLSLGVDCT